LNEVYEAFGFEKYEVYFSTRPEKRMGSDDIWDKAEAGLENAFKKLNLKYILNAGDGAFYGPKLDVMVTDAIGRKWQLGTLQVDFNMPIRFGLEYTGEDNNGHNPVMLHRAILGSFERFVGVYIEHCAGAFPTWLAPVQALVINVGLDDKQKAFAEEIVSQLKSQGLRGQADLRNEKLGYKIREAQLQKIPYMLIIGDQEVANRTVSVRLRNGTELKGVALDEFVKNLFRESKERLKVSPYASNLAGNVQP
jgi:threonyl-tRNA synthetase